MTISRPCSPRQPVGRRRAAAATAIASGRSARALTRSWTSSTAGLPEQPADLGLGGHGVGAGQPGGDQRAGGVAETHRGLQLPAREEPVAERAAEGIPRAEAVDHLDRYGR